MEPRTPLRRARSRGFTLVELLTVIAIIAILAALLMPVLATAREAARKGNCSSNIHSLIQGLQMYKDDWRVYPDALFGYHRVVPNGTCPTATGNPTGALEQSRLYPEYVKDFKVFNCPNAPVRANSDRLVDVVNRATSNLHVNNPAAPLFKYCFRDWDSYDFQFVPAATSGARELRFNKKWTAVSAGITDDARQLIYRNPPDSTVVTWCTYHSGMNSQGVIPPNGIVMVGFLSGRVQSIPASQFTAWSATSGPWQVSPKP